MPIYEFTIEGPNGQTFDASTDKTDGLVKWVEAPSLYAAELTIKKTGWVVGESCGEIYSDEDGVCSESIDLFVTGTGFDEKAKSIFLDRWTQIIASRSILDAPRAKMIAEQNIRDLELIFTMLEGEYDLVHK